jgi:hypothetical protein
MPDRAALHVDDRLVAVAPVGSSRQPDDEACPRLGEHSLERDGGKVVALVDDDVAVVRDEFVDLVVADEALDHGHVDPTRHAALPAPDLADRFRLHAEEHGELRPPLIEQGLAVDQDQRAAPASLREVGADHRLPSSRGSDENPRLVRQ